MSDAVDDMLDWEDEQEPNEVSCKFCGEEGLCWCQHYGKWVLVSMEDDEPHHCTEMKSSATEDFS